MREQFYRPQVGNFGMQSHNSTKEIETMDESEDGYETVTRTFKVIIIGKTTTYLHNKTKQS